MKVKIAFSGGLESTYLAQMFLEQGRDVELFYGSIRGVHPASIEAALVYRSYQKLAELFPDAKLNLNFVRQRYFQTSWSDDRVKCVNQAMRVACMLTDLQFECTEDIYVCGWTGDGCLEKNLHVGSYTEKDYQEMKELPLRLNHLTRLSNHPAPILTPLWGKSKQEVYNLLRPELRNYLVLNGSDQYIIDGKIDEYAEAGIPLPDYILPPDSGYPRKYRVDPTAFMNEYGRFFFTPDEWESYFYAKGYRNPVGLFNNFTTLPFNEKRVYRSSSDIMLTVSMFEAKAEHLLKLLTADYLQKQEEAKHADQTTA